MTIDEAIKNYEKTAEEEEKQAIWLWSREGNPNYQNCVERVKKQRQLAEWLRELKEYRDERVGCEYCKHKFREQHERPCSLCQRNFMDMFEREVNADEEGSDAE